ncbi:MAG: hypothetical protein MK142_06965, partial [Pseudomonadales bacterium]|nr:hypothetical protein [Pseudomonadales bacterium]
VSELALKDFAELERFGADALRAAAVPALAHFRRRPAVQDKGAGIGRGGGGGGVYDPVTVADRESERVLREAIAQAWPGDGILGEEAGGERMDSKRLWTIDPIDGTRGYVSGFAQWGMLLAFSVDGAPVLGLMHQPWTDELWIGSPLGARLEAGPRAGVPASDSPIRVRECDDLGSAVLATTDPFLFQGAEAPPFQSLLGAVRLGRYGGDCYAYCMLAMGQLDLVVESGLSPWDVRALIPIVKAAGGYITDWRGDSCADGGQVLASGDARMHECALEHLASVAKGSGA